MKPIYLPRIWSWFAIAGLVLALGACARSANPAAGSQAMPTATQRVPAAATLTDDQQRDAITQGIDRAERRWEEQGSGSYRLTATFVTVASDIRVTVVVRDGQVVADECHPEPSAANIGCTLARKSPEQYTVAGLFAELRQLLTYTHEEYASPNEAIDVEYDDQLGYPTRIEWNPPEYMGWKVADFERLP